VRILIDGVAETAYISCGQLPVDDRNGKRKVAFKERSMDSKKASRRKFLKGGAAAAAVGAIQSSKRSGTTTGPGKAFPEG